MPSPKRAILIHVATSAITGQSQASLDLEKMLTKKGWHLLSLKVPSFRNGTPLDNAVALGKLLIACIKTLFSHFDLIQVNLGQSMASFLREGLIWLLLGLAHPRSKKIISLHGHWFTEWKKRTIRQLCLQLLGWRASFITVLGPVQQETLKSWGTPESKIKIINNTTDLPSIPTATLLNKNNRDASETIQVTFLSNMIPSKGYIEFLESLRIAIERKPDFHWSIAMAGRWVDARFSQHKDPNEGPKIIRKYASMFAKTPGVAFKFHEGIDGAAKLKLLQCTHIFILPSQQEAQPMVLIEAMSQGAAIITTRVGEIPSMITQCSALFISSPPNPQEIAEKILYLAQNPQEASKIAQCAHENFENRFSWKIFETEWEKLLA